MRLVNTQGSRALAALMFSLVVGWTTQSSPAFARTVPTGKRIRELAGPVLFGARADSKESALDKELFASECNAGQFTHYPAWGGWPAEKSYGLPTLAANAHYFDAAGLPSFMHMFVGPNLYLPDWLKNGTWDKTKLGMLLKDLVQDTLSSAEAQQVSTWNIVNEALSWDGTGWEASKFLELGYEPDASGLMGSDRVFTQVPVYVRLAFEYARQSTKADLELRDYDNDGIETQNNNSVSKTKAFYQLVRHLRAKNVPLNAVGFQGHFNISNAVTWSKLSDNVKRYRDMGLKVYIAEMDAQQNNNAKTWNTAVAQVQGEYFYRYVKAALAGGVNGIFAWGLRDNQDTGWRLGENATLFDAAGEPKPAYYGVQKAFAEASLVGGAGGASTGGSGGASSGGVGGARSGGAGGASSGGVGGARSGGAGGASTGGASNGGASRGGADGANSGGAGGDGGSGDTESMGDSSSANAGGSANGAPAARGKGCQVQRGSANAFPISFLVASLLAVRLRRRRPRL